MFINLMVALGLLFLTTYRPLPRLLANQRGRDVAVASVMSVFCMLYPWYVGPGQMMDFRMVPLGLVGWRYGTAAAAAVGAVILGFRLVPGGSGVITTVVYVLGSVALVPLYHKRPHNWLTLAAVGVAQTVVGYAGIQFLLDPVPAGLEYDSPFWLMRAAVQVLGFWALHAADGRRPGARAERPQHGVRPWAARHAR
jgi:hypothetical protein